MPSERPGIWFANKAGELASVVEAVVEEDQRLTGFSLPNGVAVRTGEHMLAAIVGMELEAVEIVLEGGEVPIMDGSAFPFAEAINETGFADAPGETPRPRALRPDSARGERREALPSRRPIGKALRQLRHRSIPALRSAHKMSHTMSHARLFII